MEDASNVKRVLIVDDSPSLRTMVSYTLRDAGYEVMEAEDGNEALSMAKDNDVATLVVTDIKMPYMDGLELVRELRKLQSYKFVPILALTTEGSEETKLAGKKAGVTGWMVKPFDPESLLSTIKKVL